MKENELNELVVVEQLPIIREKLQLLSNEIDEEIKYALSLECNEENKNEVKKARANLNKIKTTLEEKRKQVKNAVMNPYTEFENIYNELVKNKLVEADNTLKSKIDEIESQQLAEKENELREFAYQHIEANNLSQLIGFDNIGLNITLSASMKSLKEQILDFINKVVSDLKLIDMEEYKEEISIEYIQSLNFADAKTKVIERHKQLEEIQKQQEEKLEQKKQEEKVVEKVEEVVEEVKPPVEIIENDELITVSFTITDTKEKILKLRDYLKENGINYE